MYLSPNMQHNLTLTELSPLSFPSTASPEAISLQQALHESVFSPGISASPPHRVALCWDKHCQLLPEVLGLTAKRVATWSSEEVRHTHALAPRAKTRMLNVLIHIPDMYGSAAADKGSICGF